jgi:hypothetical protein
LKRGFLPSFEFYLFDKYPIDNLYANSVFFTKLQQLLNALLIIENPFLLTSQYAIGKEIQPIRPGSQESKNIINETGYPYQLYRIDYGNTPFRIIFGIENKNRIAHIVIIDTKHKTYNGKNK